MNLIVALELDQSLLGARAAPPGAGSRAPGACGARRGPVSWLSSSTPRCEGGTAGGRLTAATRRSAFHAAALRAAARCAAPLSVVLARALLTPHGPRPTCNPSHNDQGYDPSLAEQTLAGGAGGAAGAAAARSGSGHAVPAAPAAGTGRVVYDGDAGEAGAGSTAAWMLLKELVRLSVWFGLQHPASALQCKKAAARRWV